MKHDRFDEIFARWADLGQTYSHDDSITSTLHTGKRTDIHINKFRIASLAIDKTKFFGGCYERKI